MKEKLVFLGIETSCDETAAAIVREKNDGTGEVLSNRGGWRDTGY